MTMNGIRILNDNKLVRAVLHDGRTAFEDLEVDAAAIELPSDIELNEYQYYVQKVGFYIVHTLTWCKQLDLAIEFLSNYDYSKKIEASRADHLIYNLENYLIRLNSVYDRVLQVVNAVFHLCVNEENVGHSVIVSNYKVQHRPEIFAHIKAVKKFLQEYEQARHTLIHKHSWLDFKLRRIELFYLQDLEGPPESDAWKGNLKTFRANYLRDYIAEKKAEFSKINEGLAELLDELLGALLDEYERQKHRLR
ncbi:MAG: hypothetical protein JRE23_16385 [Deltaproteobacteria bacterium]|nr:hypothetical protein [Deltaproteobacteria bacterium]